MLGLLFLHYNVESGDILGIYTMERNPYIPEPNIEITAATRDMVTKNPRRYKVVDKKIVEREGYEPEFSAESLALQHEEDAVNALTKDILNVDGRGYICDQTLQMNIILGYISLQNKNTKSVKFWCLVEDKWEFREHSESEVVKLANAFNTKRQNVSVNFHIPSDK